MDKAEDSVNVPINPSESVSGDAHVIHEIPTANDFWDYYTGNAVRQDDLEKVDYADHCATIDHIMRTCCIIVQHIRARCEMTEEFAPEFGGLTLEDCGIAATEPNHAFSYMLLWRYHCAATNKPPWFQDDADAGYPGYQDDQENQDLRNILLALPLDSSCRSGNSCLCDRQEEKRIDLLLQY